jgi:hypothetical protein
MIKSIRTIISQSNSLITSIERMQRRLENRGHVLSVNEKLSLQERINSQKAKLRILNDSLRTSESNRFHVSYPTRDGERKTISFHLHAA